MEHEFLVTVGRLIYADTPSSSFLLPEETIDTTGGCSGTCSEVMWEAEDEFVGRASVNLTVDGVTSNVVLGDTRISVKLRNNRIRLGNFHDMRERRRAWAKLEGDPRLLRRAANVCRPP